MSSGTYEVNVVLRRYDFRLLSDESSTLGSLVIDCLSESIGYYLLLYLGSSVIQIFWVSLRFYQLRYSLSSFVEVLK